MSNQIISIAYCGNQKVFDGILISLLSLVKHTTSILNIHILTADFLECNPNYVAITSAQCEYLKKQLTKVNPCSNVIRHDVRALYDKTFITKIDPHCTPYSLLRLLLDKIEGIPKKIIYLDTDTIINKDINELWNVNIDDYYVGVVHDPFFKKDYFNSGMMVMNMNLIKKNNMLDKCCESIKKKCGYFFVDQKILNKIMVKRLMLHNRFNSLGKYYPEIVVHHFCNVRKKWWWFHRIKPWETDLVKKKLPVYNDIINAFLDLKQSEQYKLLNESKYKSR